ncbi:MAG: FixH family protein [Salibacteraceae bacterium]
MKKFKYIALAFLSIAIISVSSCTKDDDPITPPNNSDPFENLTLIGETSAVGAGAIVKIYAEEDLFVGYNKIHVAVYDSANTTTQITDAHVTFMPMMDMGMMQHACPIENPSMTVESGTNAFKGAAVFIMPSTAGAWTFGVHVHNHTNGQEGMASLPITVNAPTEARMISFVSDYDSAKLFVARITPLSPAVGVNDIQFGIWKKETMMSFPAVDGYTMTMEPEMPSMGHGSPNNINPVSTGNGKYDGKVNFTMTGYWKLNLEFFTSASDTVKTGQSFDVTFQ